LLALKIRDIAKHNAIPVLQSPMLARALYANSEINQDIPSEPVHRGGAGVGLHLQIESRVAG
jgi:flagellar biosynthesis protein FlhB